LFLVKKLFGGKSGHGRDLEPVTNKIFSLFEPWNPLPAKGLNHKKRRTAIAVLLLQTLVIHAKNIKRLRAERLLQGFGFQLGNIDQTNLEFIWRKIEENRSHRLIEFTKLIGKSHVYLTVMEMVGFIYLTANLSDADDERVLDFFQTYPWYFTGSSGAAFMEMLRNRCFNENRINKDKQKTRREHPLLKAVARIDLDLPPGIRERSHATLPAEFPSILVLLGLIGSGGLWGRGFSERLMKFFRWGNQPFGESYLDRVVKIFENMRSDCGATVNRWLLKIDQIEGGETYYEFIKIVVELLCHNPSNYLVTRNGVYKCSLPLFAAYSCQLRPTE
jgi:hypothetical protein